MRFLLGPENPTFAERFVGLLKLPYTLSCAVLTFLISSPMVLLVLRPNLPSGNLLAYVWLVWLLVGFYSFYVPHYMRTRLLQAEKSLASILTGGEDDFHHLFGSVSSPKPQLAIWIAVSSLNFLTFLRLEFPLVLYPLVLGVVPLISIGISSMMWVYIGSLRGIHKMGSAPLKFKSFYRDRTMGLKGVGSLALALAVAYFGFLSLSIFLILYANDLLLWTAIGSFVVVGVALFFLPLRGLHLRMLEQKRIEREKLDGELEAALSEKAPNSPEDMARMFKLDLLRRDLASTATWPYDIQILSKLTVIALSVTAVLISRVIANLLHI